LRGLEGNGCLPTALRAIGHGLGFGETGTGRALALRLASLAALGFVLEILIVEEMLLSRCKHKIGTAIDARETAVLKLRHGLFPVDYLEQFVEPQTGSYARLVITPGFSSLFHFPARLLPVSFTGQRLLSPQLLTRLEVEGVTLHFLNDVLLLDLTLEAAKGIL
jgi:hypothetical protein